MGVRGPDLGAVDDVVVAVAHGAGFQRGEVGAGARLGIALAPVILAGENFRQIKFFCSGEPKPMMTGPTILTPITLTLGTPARALSASKIQRCDGVQSGPPWSTGQPGAPQPFLCRARCQAMPMSGSENTEGVSAVARFISGVRFAAMKSRTSFSKV